MENSIDYSTISAKNKNIKFPSIFNDVIGPVMRGPSSSHCAAALRIGRIARDLMNGDYKSILIEFDPFSSLATTHESQGSDMGLFAGLLGWETDDDRMVDSREYLEKLGVEIKIEINEIEFKHPNAYQITLVNSKKTHKLVGISTGGGAIEIVNIDELEYSLNGDKYVNLIYYSDNTTIDVGIGNLPNVEELKINESDNLSVIEIQSTKMLDENSLNQKISSFEKIDHICLKPVMPVLTKKNQTVPFLTCGEMLEYNKGKDLNLWELALKYESERGNISEEEVFEKMKSIVRIMRNSIKEGIEGTEYKDRILGQQCGKLKEKMEDKLLLDGGMHTLMLLYVTAIMEVKSSMGIIVAAPTAGGCSALPGAVIAAVDHMEASEEEATKAMLSAGLIGVFIAAYSTFAAEVCGCQAETGSAAGMAAAALTTLGKGNLKQTIGAASMALQNIFGLACDPVGNRVEVPCLGKNAMAAGNALASANMSLSDFDSVIPLDEVIQMMDVVGKSLPQGLRCTALGGLAITKTAKKIEEKLNSYK